MKGLKCHLTKYLSLRYFVCSLLLFCSLFSPLLFGSSHVNALSPSLSVDVYKIDESGASPRFSVNGSTFSRGSWYGLADTGVTHNIIIGNHNSNTIDFESWNFGDYMVLNWGYHTSGRCLPPPDPQPVNGNWSLISNQVVAQSSEQNDTLCWYTVQSVFVNGTPGSSYTNFQIPFRIYVSHGSPTFTVLSWSQYRPKPPADNGSGAVTGKLDQFMNQSHQDAQKQLEETKKQTDAINETKDFITDTKEPDAGDIANSDSMPSVGLLPPGPLDSILTLPLNIANSILSSLGGSCSAIVAPLPFVDKDITFPCMGDTIYKGDFAPLELLIGGPIAAVILFYYFKHLYKKVDRAVSLETTDEDEWGIL